MFFQLQTLRNPGGAYVRRRFNMGGKDVLPGAVLAQVDLEKIPQVNLRSLLSTGKLELFPVAPGAPDAIEMSRFAVHTGAGKYDVIEGVKLNDGPLSKEEAEAVVAQKDAPPSN